jgi:hypothetical protein
MAMVFSEVVELERARAIGTYLQRVNPVADCSRFLP